MAPLPSNQEIALLNVSQLADLFVSSELSPEFSYNPVTNLYSVGEKLVVNPCDIKNVGFIVQYILSKGCYIGLKPSEDGKNIVIEVNKELSAVVQIPVEQIDIYPQMLVRTFMLFRSAEQDEKQSTEGSEIKEKKK